MSSGGRLPCLAAAVELDEGGRGGGRRAGVTCDLHVWRGTVQHETMRRGALACGWSQQSQGGRRRGGERAPQAG